MEFLEPWSEVSGPGLVDELRREMASGHVLENLDLAALARRQDCDDVLYALNDGSGRLAVVHLTYRSTRETNPSFPSTTMIKELNLWSAYMQALHAAWMAEDLDSPLWLKERELWDFARE